MDTTSTKIEKLYFAITRWATLIISTLAFIAVVGGGIYAAYLYKTSKITQIDRETYLVKKPDISYDEIMKEEEDKRAKIIGVKTYVYGVIKNGSMGHGYPMGAMPLKMAEGSDAEELSVFVANKLEGEYPKSFAACASCHGVDGEGSGDLSPNLKTLPIYNGMRPIAVEPKQVIEEMEEEKVAPEKVKTPTEVKIDKVTANINRYALKVDQDGVSRKDMQKYIESISGKANSLDDFLDQLVPATAKLLDYGIQFAKTKHSIGAVKWQDFMVNFTTKYLEFEEVEAQKVREVQRDNVMRQNAKNSEAAEAQIQLLIALNGIGIAMAIFLLLTLILVLMKVEKNTRKEKRD